MQCLGGASLQQLMKGKADIKTLKDTKGILEYCGFLSQKIQVFPDRGSGFCPASLKNLMVIQKKNLMNLDLHIGASAYFSGLS